MALRIQFEDKKAPFLELGRQFEEKKTSFSPLAKLNR
jgi:hypothetical protein